MSFPFSAEEPWAALTKTAPPLQPPSPYQPDVLSRRTEPRASSPLDFLAPAMQASPPAPGQAPWKHVSWPWSRPGQAPDSGLRAARPLPASPSPVEETPR